MNEYGIIVVSHSRNIAQGIFDLLSEVAKDVDITYVGGNEDGSIGTNFDTVLEIINENPKDKLLAFFDLGSAKMNLDMAVEMTDKDVEIFQVPVVEGAYTAAALLQANATIDMIKAQLEELTIIK